MIKKTKCMIIAAAPVTDRAIFREFNPNKHYVICADAGYQTAERFSIKPDYIVGDFDSAGTVPDTTKGNVTVLPEEKDFTDTMYAVMIGLKMGFKEFVFVGCTGGRRVDHTLSNYNIMLYLARKNCSCIMVDDISKTFLLNANRLTVTKQRGSLFSVYPFGSAFCNLSLNGAKYPLNRKDIFMGDELMAISNEINSDKAEIIVHSGFALVIIYNKTFKDNEPVKV